MAEFYRETLSLACHSLLLLGFSLAKPKDQQLLCDGQGRKLSIGYLE
jgi:hypothetical protein